MNELEQETLMYLKNKYPKNLRNVARFYQSGIPEKYWNMPDMDNSKEIFKSAAQNDALIFMSDPVDKANRELMIFGRDAILQKHVVYRVDFFLIMSKVTNAFGNFNFENVLRLLQDVEVLILTGIKFGTVYDKMDEIFGIFLGNLMESVISKKILMSVEKPVLDKPANGDLEKYLKVYNELNNFYFSNTVILNEIE